MIPTALLALVLALLGGAPRLGNILDLMPVATGKAGNSFDPNGLAATGEAGGSYDPDGLAATGEAGSHVDPNG